MQTEITEPMPKNGLADLVRRLAERLHVPTTMIKFVIVGGIGFLINEAVLFLLYDGGLLGFVADKHEGIDLGLARPEARLLYASIIAVEFAIVCQFNLHERWTFRQRNRDGNIFVRFLKFNAGSIVSPIVTVLCVNVLTPEIRDTAGRGHDRGEGGAVHRERVWRGAGVQLELHLHLEGDLAAAPGTRGGRAALAGIGGDSDATARLLDVVERERVAVRRDCADFRELVFEQALVDFEVVAATL